MSLKSSLLTVALAAGIALTALSGSAAVAAPAKGPAFDLPFSWKSDTVKGAPADAAGYDPINMVIIGVSPAVLIGALSDGRSTTHWHQVEIGTNFMRDRCISAQDAAVQPKDSKKAEQDFSWRTVECTSTALLSSKKITNHARGYLQKATGAYFLAVSEEHFCLVGKHGLTPWHCITKDGYDQGRDDLIKDLGEALSGGYTMSVTYSKPGKYYKAGEVPQKPLDYHAKFDGRVAIVTIKPLGCAPLC